MDRLRPGISGFRLGQSCIEKEKGSGTLNSWMGTGGLYGAFVKTADQGSRLRSCDSNGCVVIIGVQVQPRRTRTTGGRLAGGCAASVNMRSNGGLERLFDGIE